MSRFMKLANGPIYLHRQISFVSGSFPPRFQDVTFYDKVQIAEYFSNHVRRICFLFPPLTVLLCHENTLLTECASEEMLLRTFSQIVTKLFFSNCLGQSEKKRS